jgi:hypothetical protein
MNIDVKDLQNDCLLMYDSSEYTYDDPEDIFEEILSTEIGEITEEHEPKIRVYQPVYITSPAGKEFLKDEIERAVDWSWIYDSFTENYPENCEDMYEFFFAGQQGKEEEIEFQLTLEKSFKESNFIDMLVKNLTEEKRTVIKYNEIGILTGYTLQDYIKENKES